MFVCVGIPYWQLPVGYSLLASAPGLSLVACCGMTVNVLSETSVTVYGFHFAKRPSSSEGRWTHHTCPIAIGIAIATKRQ